MKKLLVLVLWMLSLPVWGDLVVNLTETASPTDPPGSFYTVSVPIVDQMKTGLPASQHVYMFIGVMHAQNAAGLIPVDMLSLNSTTYTQGALTGKGVTSTSYTFDPNAFTSPPVNVSSPGSTAGLSIAVDQSSIVSTNVGSILAGMQAGDAIWVVVGTGTNPNEALGNGILSGTTKEVFKKQLLLSAAPNLLSSGHTIGSTGCPQPMGTVNVTSLLAAGQVLNVSATSSNPVFKFSNDTNALTLTVATGTSTPVPVKFDCTANPPQSGTITFVGSAAGVGHTHTVTVTVTLAKN